MRKVYVTGIGVVSSLSHNLDQFWRGCLAGQSQIEEVPREWGAYYDAKSRFWSPLELPDYDSFEINSAYAAPRDTAVLNAVVASESAIRHSGLQADVKDIKSRRYMLRGVRELYAGVFCGTGLGCITSILDSYVPHLLARAFGPALCDIGARKPGDPWQELKNNLSANPRVSPLASLRSMSSSLSSSVSIRYGFKGPSETIFAACASGASAVLRGLNEIRTGRLDLALCGGSEYFGDRAGSVFMAFDRLGALARGAHGRNRINRPFDTERSGFLFSQGGACMLVLESEEFLKSRRGTALAELAGGFSTSDAASLVSIDPEDTTIHLAINGALADARESLGSVDYVNAHGTGTETNDAVEAATIRRLFGYKPLVNSTKSLLGHTIGASGAFGVAVTALSLRDQIVHPSLNVETPVAAIRIPSGAERAVLKVAITQNFGFGGHNVVLVLRQPSD
ncbi:MAG: beta-ketoacyl synthase [Gammaproteobacteria bacterium]